MNNLIPNRMKKLALTLVLFTLGTSAFSQSFKFGPKAGMNISNYTGGNIESDALVGFHLGGLLNFGIGKNFSIQPEVLFSTQGAKIDNAGSKKDYKINYVSVPVMLKLRSNGGFYIEAGPQVAFRANENIPDQTINNFSKNLDLAVGGGLGYQAGFGLGIGARYVAGVSKVGDFSGQPINPDFKNSIIQLSLFWAIPVR
jgi:hypothetical protein